MKLSHINKKKEIMFEKKMKAPKWFVDLNQQGEKMINDFLIPYGLTAKGIREDTNKNKDYSLKNLTNEYNIPMDKIETLNLAMKYSTALMDAAWAKLKIKHPHLRDRMQLRFDFEAKTIIYTNSFLDKIVRSMKQTLNYFQKKGQND